MAEEKVLTLNLRKDMRKIQKWKRSSGVAKLVREQVRKQTKASKITIDKKVNEKIWSRGIGNPPSKLRLKIIKQDKGIKVELL